MNTQPTRDELWWAGPELRPRLESDPIGYLKERGVGVPSGMPLPVIHEFVRVASLLWVDGLLVPFDRFHIDPADEGLLFGRGVWESTRTIGGVSWLWPTHLDRLVETSRLLNVAVAAERLPDAARVSEYVRALTSQDVVVRLNVTAGRPGKAGLVWMSAAPLPAAPPSLRLRTCRSPVRKGQASLTLKTFQYATRLRIGQLAAEAGFETALLLDEDDNLQEAAHANLFVRFDDGWATPLADGGLLPGTVRQLLLARSPLTIRELVIPAARLGEVREAFLTNSNLGIVPVTQIDERQYPIGEQTRELIRWLQPPPTGGTQYRFADRGGVPR